MTTAGHQISQVAAARSRVVVGRAMAIGSSYHRFLSVFDAFFLDMYRVCIYTGSISQQPLEEFRGTLRSGSSILRITRTWSLAPPPLISHLAERLGLPWW